MRSYNWMQGASSVPRRLLQMGVYNCQLYNNLGLCCFYAQQYDMTLSSFERALTLVANDEELADVWYNIGHVAVVSEQTREKYQKVYVVVTNNVSTKNLEASVQQIETELCFFFKGIGDLVLAYQCFKLTLAFNNDHAEAYNNLAVLELRKGHIEQVRSWILFNCKYAKVFVFIATMCLYRYNKMKVPYYPH